MITTKAAPTLLPAITGVAQALPSGTLPTPANHPDPRKAPLSHEAGSNTPPTMLGSRPCSHGEYVARFCGEPGALVVSAGAGLVAASPVGSVRGVAGRAGP
jgi:hypothetical protein